MAPHASETPSDGGSEDLKPGVAPSEPGISKTRAKMQTSNLPRPPKFEDKYEERDYLKGRLAAAFRIFGKYGFDEGVAGHITLRDPVDPKSDLIHVNEEGEIIGGGECRLLNEAAFMIHSAIHQSRPDVIAAAHSHSIYGRTFCTLGIKLDTISQDACAFHNDHVLYESFNGIVLAAEEGINIAKCLGENKAALLVNHGLLTVGKTVEEAVYWFINMEKCCQTQLLADAAAAGRGGETRKIDEEDAVYTRQAIGTPLAGYFNAKPAFDLIHKETGGDYLG